MENKILSDRIKKLLFEDRAVKSDTLIGVLKSDLFDLFSNYFVLDKYHLDANLEQTDGGFVFSCKLDFDKIKSLNHLN